MEFFIWKGRATCSDYYELYPRRISQFDIRLPLLSPWPSIDSVCECQNLGCEIRARGACSGRAVFTEVYPVGSNLAGVIIPELRSIRAPQLKIAGIPT